MKPIIAPATGKVLCVCDKRLRPTQRRIAAQLAEHMNEAGRACITTEELAAQCGCGVQDIADALTWLKRWGCAATRTAIWR
jgi:hypothetical protein